MGFSILRASMFCFSTQSGDQHWTSDCCWFDCVMFGASTGDFPSARRGYKSTINHYAVTSLLPITTVNYYAQPRGGSPLTMFHYRRFLLQLCDIINWHCVPICTVVPTPVMMSNSDDDPCWCRTIVNVWRCITTLNSTSHDASHLGPGAVLAEKIWGPGPPVMASAGARAYQGGLVALPPAGVQGQSPRWGVRGRSPPEADDILTVKHAIFGLNCTSNRTFIKAKTGSTVHKNIPQNGIRQRALQRIAEVAII